jgi:hypothetical protein
MIFPDVSLEEWKKRFPKLKEIVGACDACGASMITRRPFLEKNYAGLVAESCSCGKNRHAPIIGVTTSAQEHQKWALFSYL